MMLGLGVVVAVVLAAGSWYFFTEDRLLIDFTYPLLSSFLVYLTLMFSNYFREQAQRRRIRSAFGQYLSPALVEQLAHSPEKLVLGGEERDMTILFSDVRGFTTISELFKHDPQGLTHLMNSFLTPLTNAIIDRKGTIDKYMGDAIMAFWNAPLDDPAHEINACEAALDMQQRVKTLNVQREQRGRGERPALHPDQCRRRHQYRALRGRQYGLRPALQLFGAGRHRQSGLAAGGPDQVLRRPDHHRRAHRGGRARTNSRCWSSIASRSKARPSRRPSTRCWVARSVARSDGFDQLRHVVDEMIARYRQRDFAGAPDALIRCREAGDGFGLDSLFALYETRIRVFQQNPPPAEWDGVFVSESK